MSSIKQLAIRGMFWTIASYGSGQILRFLNNLVLTRLLAPDLFGLMALVTIFITGLHLFSDVGLGINVIQNKRGDEPEFLNTIWTVQVLRGGVLWLASLFIAFPLAQVYEEPQLLWLIPTVAFINTVISGFNSTALYTLNRQMAFSQQTLIDLVTQIISIVVMLVWAWLSPSIWALVGGTLVATIIKLIWSHLVLPGEQNKFAWDQDAIAEIFLLGRWIFVSTGLTFLAEQADRLVLGKLFSLEQLGIYSIALVLSDLPRQVTIALSSKVIFPAVSKLSDLPRPEFRAKILHNRRLMLGALILGMTLLIGFGDQAILLLYDQRYKAAAWMLPILAVGIWPRLICVTIEPGLFALGIFKYTTVGNLFRLIFTVAAILIGFAWLGVPGAIIAVALNDLFYYLVVSYGLCCEGLSCVMQDLQATGLLLALVAIAVWVRIFFGLGLPIDGWLTP
jgi:O-antigen/teichoic acid export membrane protein